MDPAPPTASSGAIVRSISREELAKLPIRRYEGKVCLVTTPQELQHARGELRHERLVGFDTETRPSFRKGEKHLPCLVQVASARTVYLFQLRRSETLPVVGELLENPHILKAGVALAHDLRELKLVFAFSERNVLDLGVVARRSGLPQTGVRNLAAMILGWRIPKGARTSNWAAPRLAAAQIAYAATDAWVCRELYGRFDTLGLLEHEAGVGKPASHMTL